MERSGRERSGARSAGAGGGQPVHLTGAGASECPGCGRERGAGGDDIVDHQDADIAWQGSDRRSEIDAVPTLSQRASGLVWTGTPLDQQAAGKVEAPGHRLGQQLGLVEPPLAAAPK